MLLLAADVDQKCKKPLQNFFLSKTDKKVAKMLVWSRLWFIVDHVQQLLASSSSSTSSSLLSSRWYPLDDGYTVIDQKRDKGGFLYNILADKSPMRADDGWSRKKMSLTFFSLKKSFFGGKSKSMPVLVTADSPSTNPVWNPRVQFFERVFFPLPTTTRFLSGGHSATHFLAD